jgi:hypothetical protein
VPILVVYLLVLIGSPVGEAGSLWVHIVIAHGGVASVRSPEPTLLGLSSGQAESREGAGLEKAGIIPLHHHEGHAGRFSGPASAERHTHDHRHHQTEGGQAPVHHEHHDDDRSAAEAPHARTSSGGHIPHEHDGIVHTHEGRTPDDATPENTLSRFFLSPRFLIESPPPLAAKSRLVSSRSSDEPAALVDTPPPRPPV